MPQGGPPADRRVRTAEPRRPAVARQSAPCGSASAAGAVRLAELDLTVRRAPPATTTPARRGTAKPDSAPAALGAGQLVSTRSKKSTSFALLESCSQLRQPAAHALANDLLRATQLAGDVRVVAASRTRAPRAFRSPRAARQQLEAARQAARRRQSPSTRVRSSSVNSTGLIPSLRRALSSTCRAERIDSLWRAIA